MTFNNDMIDTIINPDDGQDENDSIRVKGPRKENSAFSTISNKMLWDARELQRIAREDMPRAFPLTPPKGEIDSRYKHTPYEMMGAGFLTDIEDGLYAIDVVKEISIILEGLQLVINSLFPTEFDNGSYTITLTDHLKKIKDNADTATMTVQKYLDSLEENVNADPIRTIDVRAIQKLERHLIRLGYEFVKNGVIPSAFTQAGDNSIRPDAIIRDRIILAEKNIPPSQVEHMLMDSGKEPASLPDRDDFFSSAASELRKNWKRGD
jgi:hypothetical protein